MKDLELRLKVFKIVDELDARLVVARNTEQDLYKVKSDIRDELIEVFKLAPKTTNKEGKE